MSRLPLQLISLGHDYSLLLALFSLFFSFFANFFSLYVGP